MQRRENIDDRADVYALGVAIFDAHWAAAILCGLSGDIIGMPHVKVPPQLSASMPDVDPQLWKW